MGGQQESRNRRAIHQITLKTTTRICRHRSKTPMPIPVPPVERPPAPMRWPLTAPSRRIAVVGSTTAPRTKAVIRHPFAAAPPDKPDYRVDSRQGDRKTAVILSFDRGTTRCRMRFSLCSLLCYPIFWRKPCISPRVAEVMTVNLLYLQPTSAGFGGGGAMLFALRFRVAPGEAAVIQPCPCCAVRTSPAPRRTRISARPARGSGCRRRCRWSGRRARRRPSGRRTGRRSRIWHRAGSAHWRTARCCQ